MKVVVAGKLNEKLLLSTTEATAVLISTNDGRPAFVLQMLPNERGFIRYTKGEDKNFEQIVKQLGLTE